MGLMAVAIALFGTGMGLIVYTYALYPGILKVLAAGRGNSSPREDPEAWPTVSISLPTFNDEQRIAEALESLLSLNYPKDRLQILVVSDASSDRTDDIVRAYADRGVEFLRIPERRGKAAAEIAATDHLTGEIVVCTDASIRVAPDALKPLVRAFSDREVGLASGREISVVSGAGKTRQDEAGHMGYEVAIRHLESRVGGVVGAAGHLYAIRLHLHRGPLRSSLSREFAAALHCRERGYRAVFVPEAVGYVPRGSPTGLEYGDRVEGITRTLRTLLHKRHLMNPFRYGLFAWMLVSHNVCRWIVPWAGVAALAGLTVMAPSMPWAAVVLSLTVVALSTGALGWLASDRALPRLLLFPATALMGNVAAMHAVLRVMRGDASPRRDPKRAPTSGH